MASFDRDNDPTQLIDLTGSDGDEEDEDDDEELKLAIALSLQDQMPTKTPAPQAISQTSTREQPSSVADEKTGSKQNDNKTSVKSELGAAQPLVRLDRKQMEADRLARLKRKHHATAEDRPVSPPPLRRHLPSNTNTKPLLPPELKDKSAVKLPIHHSPNLSSSATLPTKTPSPHSPSHLWNGKVFLTSLDPTQPQSISLPNLLKPIETTSTLKSALLSTFVVDFDWLLPHFDTRKVSFVLALHAQNEQEKNLLRQDFADIPNVRLVFPHVGGLVNCMHSKLMLLFYEDAQKGPATMRCRIVVPSANLTPADWGVGAVMENILFVIDLPLRDATTSAAAGVPNTTTTTSFKAGLVQMLQAMGTPGDVVSKLDIFDFSRTSPYKFVHTIGGSHVLASKSETTNLKSFFNKGGGTAASAQPSTSRASGSTINTGLYGLSEAIRSMGLCLSEDDASYPPRVDFITSSLGNLKHSFLENLLSAVCGSMLERPARGKVKAGGANALKNINIYFPSDQTVRNSKGGPRSAGTICFQSRWWGGPGSEFPRELLRDCIGARQDGILMHSKVVFVRFAKPKQLSPKNTLQRDPPTSFVASHKGNPPTFNPLSAIESYAGWAYLGSANLSESAWGSSVTDNKTKQPKLNCRNWESGVIIPIPSKSEHEGKNLHDLTLEEVFADFVPVPIEFPGAGMLANGRRPWFFNG